jgi:hypothetical protein
MTAEYYSESNPDDWDYDAPDNSVRRECVICRQMFVGPEADDPVCHECFYADPKPQTANPPG